MCGRTRSRWCRSTSSVRVQLSHACVASPLDILFDSVITRPYDNRLQATTEMHSNTNLENTRRKWTFKTKLKPKGDFIGGCLAVVTNRTKNPAVHEGVGIYIQPRFSLQIIHAEKPEIVFGITKVDFCYFLNKITGYFADVNESKPKLPRTEEIRFHVLYATGVRLYTDIYR